MKQKRVFTEAELKKAWGFLMFGEDWQGRIVCQVPTPHLEVILASIEYYTGTEALVYPVPGGDSKVIASGYRLGPWKDKIPERTPR